MNPRLPWKNPRRRGISSIEALVALGVLGTVLSMAPPLLLQNQRLLRGERAYRLAVDALSNRLDTLTAMTADELREAIEPAPVEGLTDASLRGELAETELGTRITLILTQPGIGSRPSTVQLVGWSFTDPPASAGAGEGTP